MQLAALSRIFRMICFRLEARTAACQTLFLWILRQQIPWYEEAIHGHFFIECA